MSGKRGQTRYVGIGVYRWVFKCGGYTPTPQTHPMFRHIAGPFPTQRGAVYYRDNYPAVRSVKLAEAHAKPV